MPAAAAAAADAAEVVEHQEAVLTPRSDGWKREVVEHQEAVLTPRSDGSKREAVEHQEAVLTPRSDGWKREVVEHQEAVLTPRSDGSKREVVEHQEGVLTLYSDGTFQRCTDAHVPASDGVFGHHAVATRDVVLDPDTGVWARIFLPEPAAAADVKSPIVLHFHGGGFCVGSAAAPHTHAFCRTMSLASRCLWVSVDYRLAPEHKLPAAYCDGIAAFRWLATSDDPWLSGHGDLGAVFLAGESAGATMVHYVAGEVAKQQAPGKLPAIAGLVLVHPAFPQERPAFDPGSANLSGARVRFYHTSALPEGAEYGHPLMNPLHPETSVKVSEVPDVPVLVAAAERDPLLAGAEEYYRALASDRDRDRGRDHVGGAPVELLVSKGVGHCFHLFPDDAPEASAEIRGRLLAFIAEHHV